MAVSKIGTNALSSGLDVSSTNISYTGTLTGGTGVVNIGSGQVYKDASGNVGIGTGSPSFTSGGGLMVQNGTQANLRLDRFGEGGFELQSIASTLRFYSTAASAERMRIDASGNLLVGATAFPSGNAIASFGIESTSTYKSMQMGKTFSGSIDALAVYHSGTKVGSVVYSNTATAYNTSSDYRLKHDIQPMTGALARVAALKPVTYKWNADDSDGEGFIAHELAEVCPGAVTGEKDAVEEDGSIKPQGIDTSFLVATLTAAIQELKAELDSVKAELAVLKGV